MPLGGLVRGGCLSIPRDRNSAIIDIDIDADGGGGGAAGAAGRPASVKARFRARNRLRKTTFDSADIEHVTRVAVGRRLCNVIVLLSRRERVLAHRTEMHLRDKRADESSKMVTVAHRHSQPQRSHQCDGSLLGRNRISNERGQD
ncbi:hypothetical protein EVAR_52967_1 [Eumeta japonica]|uniref:Uncharacterized protein n=1 Tax=Eumeta variegata TaxID=151549 RepID=A0A4C1YZC6_EUMVA|nr:hypothetical protein EVAR_52967_1 [Eumeta japonica]